MGNTLLESLTEHGTGSHIINLDRNGLEMECAVSPQGRISRKTERQGQTTHDYTYRFDEGGHLLEVLRDGLLEEEYKYNGQGQRVKQKRVRPGASTEDADGLLEYDRRGRLVKAGGMTLEYDKHGALTRRQDHRGITFYTYNSDGMLETAELPTGAIILYEYSASCPFNPLRRFKNGHLTVEYDWHDPFRLGGWRDYDHELAYTFGYTGEGHLDTVTITPLPEADEQAERLRKRDSGGIPTVDYLGDIFRREKLAPFKAGTTVLRCRADQVGTLKTLVDERGAIIKNVDFDSFGNVQEDTRPSLFLPVGFAGGLADRDTGLVRFGYRDYDPVVGRFTSPDPLGDTGGDHDLYDYCVDDPVTMNDPSGLIPPLLLFLGCKALALGIAAAGSYGSAWVADRFNGAKTGERTTAAVDGVTTVAPMVGKASAISSLPAILTMGPGAVTSAGRHLGTAFQTGGQRVGAALQASGHLDKVMNAAQFAEGFLVPTMPSNLASSWGAGLSWAIDHWKRQRNR